MGLRIDNLPKTISKLKRRLKRNKLKVKEQNFTYFGGFSLGYLKGKVSVLEDLIETLEGD